MPDTSNVVIAKPKDLVGGIYVAPPGTTIPTKYSTTLPAAFKPLGYLTEDGVSRKIENKTDSVKAWGGTKVASTREGAESTVAFQAYEYLNPNVQELVYGHANITYTASSGELNIKGDPDAVPPHCIMVIDVLTETAQGRIVYPDFQVSSLSDVKLTSKEPTALELTGDIFKDASGNAFYEYWKNGGSGNDTAAFVGFDLNAPASSGS